MAVLTQISLSICDYFLCGDINGSVSLFYHPMQFSAIRWRQLIIKKHLLFSYGNKIVIYNYLSKILIPGALIYYYTILVTLVTVIINI